MDGFQSLARRESALPGPQSLRAHPAFPAIFAEYCHEVVAPLRGQRLMVKLFGQRAPTEVAALIVILHASARFAEERPTLTRIQQRLPGTRQVATFVAVLRGFGLVQVERDPHDRRIRYLVPGPRIHDGLRGWLELHLRCWDRLAPPGAMRLGGTLADPCRYRAILERCTPLLDRDARPLNRFPDLAWLDEHDGGLLLALLLAGASGEWIASQAAGLARTLALSKSHIRNLLNEMEARGLLAHDPRRLRLRLTWRFRDAVEGWFCAQVSWLAEAASGPGGQIRPTFPVAMS